MGTSMVSFVQVKNDQGDWQTLKLYTKKNGEYQEAWTITDNRNYILFEKLAGVRGCGDPIVELRGWVDDPTEDIQECIDNGFFTPTWFDYCELDALSDTKKAFSYDYDEQYVNVLKPWLDRIDIILDAYGIYYLKPGECRIVICFS